MLEPSRKFRFTCSPEHDGGVQMELEWTAAVGLFEEPAHYTRAFGRVISEGTRLVQTGLWEGHIVVDGQTFDVNHEGWSGARDRAWGVRAIGLEREPDGIMQAHRDEVHRERAALWIWSPMQFDDYSIHFAIGENAEGRRAVDTVRRMPSIESGLDVEVLRGAEHDLKFHPETREFVSGSVSWEEIDGSVTSVEMTPVARGWMRAGTGYGGPDAWRHGKYMGEMWSDSVSYDTTDLSLTQRLGPTHVVCRMESSNGDQGMGLFETQVYGAYPRYGFDR
ncbi:hypothetical protein ACH47B_36795 [Rhodococcus sp. NPDC019627]|uniref:hypothetical protein n=1 Tax=unclassified Rhodococcus (in: high G+C Gram-positive bacteria) TaxID=192944 RepID=UPI00340575D1